MAQSKMASVGELQAFENLTALPADFRKAINKFADSNDYCMQMMAQVQRTMRTIDNKVNTTSEKIHEMSIQSLECLRFRKMNLT
jgi:septation ring formation regulator EzrA